MAATQQAASRFDDVPKVKLLLRNEPAAARPAASPPAAPLTAEEAQRQAEEEGLTLLRSASSATGFQGVTNSGSRSKAKPYQAKVRRGGNHVHLGSFATAEEAALAFARSPEGRAAAAAAAAPPPPPEPHMTAEEARRQAEAEGLALLRSESNASGFQGVSNGGSKARPFQAKVRRGGTMVFLGSFATAEEAALAIARSPEGRAAAVAPPPAPPMTAEEARRQAEAEGLALLRSESNASGFQGVSFNSGSKARPHQAQVWRDGMTVSLGTFATAEEAALAFARSPEGRARTEAAAAAAPSPPCAARARRQAEAEPPAMPADATVFKEEEAPPAWPHGAVVKTEVVKVEPSLTQEQPPMAMPDDATVVKEEAWPAKEEDEMQDQEEESPGASVKRRRLR